MFLGVVAALGFFLLGHFAPFPFLLDVTPRTVWRMPDTFPPTVYLTFDDGPNPDATPALLDVLARHQVRATFFVIDKHLTSETAPIVRRMFEEGHGVALHAVSELGLRGLLWAWITYECVLLFSHLPFPFTRTLYRSARWLYGNMNVTLFWGMEILSAVFAVLVADAPIPRDHHRPAFLIVLRHHDVEQRIEPFNDAVDRPAVRRIDIREARLIEHRARGDDV